MPAYPRREIVSTDQIGVYHCVARCVRRAFLCGVDPVSGNDNNHRKSWIRQRLQQLAPIFGIDVCGYAVMSNHLHVVLRIRPDLAQCWSNQEIAARWLRLYPPRDPVTGRAAEVEERHLAMITSDPARVAQLRERLMSLSWFMRCLIEPIARAANREHRCTGRFWEGRFKSQALLDDAAILACSVYVDLNPVRAGISETPEESEFTSAFDRIQSLKRALADSANAESASSESVPDGSIIDSSPREQETPDAWLCELTLQEAASVAVQTGEIEAQPSDRDASGERLEVASPVGAGAGAEPKWC